jgi:hypothetical protein
MISPFDVTTPPGARSPDTRFGAYAICLSGGYKDDEDEVRMKGHPSADDVMNQRLTLCIMIKDL